jgi:hypothetical protein
MFPVVPTDGTSVTYHEDFVTAGADFASGKMAKPLDLGELSGLSKIEVSPITRNMDTYDLSVMKFRISKRDLNTSSLLMTLPVVLSCCFRHG